MKELTFYITDAEKINKKYGEDYVCREINSISNSMQKCLSEVEQILVL